MELPLKPNILDDLAKENYSETIVDKYTETVCEDINLEDESGRIRLTGTGLVGELLVTGCVVAVLGSETADGEFDVIDMKFPDLAPQAPLPPIPERRGKSMILVSGLNVTGEEDGNMELELLLQYLTGELCGPSDQEEAGSITHLVIAGNSLCQQIIDESTPEQKVKTKRYGYDPNTYNPKPTQYLDEWLSSILPSLPATILPGELDPAGFALPQQQLHPALLPTASKFNDLHFVTNPWGGDIGGIQLLGTSGQNLEDAFRYIPPAEGDVRLDLLERTLRWRCIAPTCPDTLCKLPFLRLCGYGR
jgi:DNA polymerase delta subunit 2